MNAVNPDFRETPKEILADRQDDFVVDTMRAKQSSGAPLHTRGLAGINNVRLGLASTQLPRFSLDFDSLSSSLSYLSGEGLCAILCVNKTLRDRVKCFLASIVVAPNQNQGWSVPVDVLRLNKGALTSAEYGISIDGSQESIRRLNALLVPAPESGLVFVGGETYITLSPILRCRWKGDSPTKGSWTLSFSMTESSCTSQSASLLRREDHAAADAWEVIDNPDARSTSDDIVQARVDHFCVFCVHIRRAALARNALLVI